MAFCLVGAFTDQEQAMGEEAGSDNKVKETIEAVTALVKAVPIYQDALQPAAKQLGKSLETVGKVINVALAPVGALVWGYEKCQEFISTKVADRLKDVPPEDIITPKPNIAGPAIEALRYTGHEESLSDMYANLLATAMDKNTADGAHPAFVEIIKQFTPDEAKLIAFFLEERPLPIVHVRALKTGAVGGVTIANSLSLFGEQAKLEYQLAVPSYLNNLSRLGLISLPESHYTDEGIYDELEASEVVQQQVAIAAGIPDRTPKLVRRGVWLTNFGLQFGRACIMNRSDAISGAPQA